VETKIITLGVDCQCRAWGGSSMSARRLSNVLPPVKFWLSLGGVVVVRGCPPARMPDGTITTNRRVVKIGKRYYCRLPHGIKGVENG
jgi:hypothetical protein